MKKIFGGSESRSQNQTKSGYGALPSFAQKGFRGISDLTQDVLGNVGQYFEPLGLTPEEQAARQALMPQNFTQSIQDYMSPYRDIVFEDINRAFEQGPLAALNQGANEAGAFGSSRYGQGAYDVTRGLTDALRSASQAAFEQAQGQRQQGISNLLGFGQLERGVDLARRQALPTALGFARDIYSPLLSSSEGLSTSRSDTSKGIVPALSGFFGG